MSKLYFFMDVCFYPVPVVLLGTELFGRIMSRAFRMVAFLFLCRVLLDKAPPSQCRSNRKTQPISSRPKRFVLEAEPR